MSETLSNIPERVDLRIKQGSAFSFVSKFEFSLTGAVLRLRAKKTLASNDDLIELLIGSGITLSTQDLADDTATVQFSEAETAALPCGCWVYDYERNGTPIMSGGFEIVGEV